MRELHGSPSHLRAMARLVWGSLRERRGNDRTEGVPKRRLAVEWRGDPTRTDKLADYLAVTGGGAIADGSRAAASLPPLYPVLWETALFLDLLAGAPELKPLGGLIHRASERLQLRPIHIGDRVRCRVELDRAEPTARGVQLTLISRNWTEAGQLCSQEEMLVLIRERGASGRRSRAPLPRGGGGERERAGRHGDDSPAGARELTRWPLRANHGRRYARISGDYNPIHLWPWTARPFGFRRPILHGYCIEAMVAHALINSLWAGDPAALRRLHIVFRKPLLLPMSIRLLVREEDAGRGPFWLVGAGDEREPRVYAEGSFAGG